MGLTTGAILTTRVRQIQFRGELGIRCDGVGFTIDSWDRWDLSAAVLHVVLCPGSYLV